MKYFLNKDIISSSSRKTYGLKGEIVSIIGDHDNCVTVSCENGKMFGINKSYLSTEFIKKEPIEINQSLTKTKKR